MHQPDLLPTSVDVVWHGVVGSVGAFRDVATSGERWVASVSSTCGIIIGKKKSGPNIEAVLGSSGSTHLVYLCLRFLLLRRLLDL